MQDIIIRLGGLKTNEFNSVFNYSEKIVLITFLIDGIHDLFEFKNIINQRNDEKTWTAK